MTCCQVPDVRYVIDAGLSRESCYDPTSQLESLQTVLASKASAKQRQGRAGRVGPGLCFRMYPRAWWDDGQVAEQAVSELQRAPLERLVLQALVLAEGGLQLGSPESFLLSAMEPPEVEAIRCAVARLTEVGAVTADEQQRQMRSCGQLTALGRVCAELPLDTALTRLVLLGRGLGVAEGAIELAACMSNTKLFNRPRGAADQLAAFESRLRWADGSRSDALAARNAFRQWRRQGSRSDQRWAREYRVDLGALREIGDLVKDVRNRLAGAKLRLIAEHGGGGSLPPQEEEELLQLALFGAGYPRVFVGKVPKFLSIDPTADSAGEARDDRAKDLSVEVVNAPPRATAETIAGALSPSSSMQLACAPECVFHDHTKSHWRLSYSGAGGDSLLPVTLAMKIGEIQASEGRRGNGDWRLDEATTGHARRVTFVSAVDRTQHPAFVDRDSLNSVLVERAEGSGGGPREDIVLVAAFVAATAASAARRASGAVVGGQLGLNLRCTSVMPSAWSQPLPMLAMLFAPRLTLRTDRRKTRVLGVRVPGVVQEESLRTVVGAEELNEIDAMRKALTDALSAPATLPAQEHCVAVGRRMLQLLRGERRRRVKPRPRFDDHPEWPDRRNVRAARAGASECSAVLPSLELGGLRPGASPPEDDSDEEAGSRRQADIDRMWESALSGGRVTFCMVCQKPCKSAAGLLKHLRTSQHKTKEEAYLREGGRRGR